MGFTLSTQFANHSLAPCVNYITNEIQRAKWQRKDHNCMSYALNALGLGDFICLQDIRAIESFVSSMPEAGFAQILPHAIKPSAAHIVALFTAPTRPDFHLLRLDTIGQWSHKEGWKNPELFTTNTVDISETIIHDNYFFKGYFAIKNSGVLINADLTPDSLATADCKDRLSKISPASAAPYLNAPPR